MSETMLGTGMWALWMVAMTVVAMFPFWFIVSKAGYPKWISLLMLVPLVNVIFLYFLAFAKWPSQESSNT
jgi:hypothetical protein